MTRLDELAHDVAGNDLMWELVDRVEQDRARRHMDRCAQCGINLAKVDPKDVIVEVRFEGEANHRRPVETGRLWCSARCREYELLRDRRKGKP